MKEKQIFSLYVKILLIFIFLNGNNLLQTLLSLRRVELKHAMQTTDFETSRE